MQANSKVSYETTRRAFGVVRANMPVPANIERPKPDTLTQAQRSYYEHLERQLKDIDEQLKGG